MSNSKWLLPVLGSSFCWAVSDVLCDVVIEEDSDSDEDWDDESSESDIEQEPLLISGDNGVAITRTNKGEIGNSSKMKNSGHDSEADSVTIPTASSFDLSGGSGLRKLNNRSMSGRSEKNQKSNVNSPSRNEDGNEVSPKSRAASNGALKSLLLDKNAGKIPADAPTSIDGEQDAAIAGLVSTIFSYILCLQRLSQYVNPKRTAAQEALGSSLITNIDSGMSLIEETSYSASGSSFDFRSLTGPNGLMLWSPFEDVEWWFASLGGISLFLHYILVLWAFDSAPSTVISPLVQMASVTVLFGSAIPAWMTGDQFMRPLDLVSYIIIWVGGILPSIDSKFSEMFTRKFWAKPFVRNVVLSEVSLGVYDLLIGYCLQTSVSKAKFLDLPASALEDEFIYLAWCWFSISFALSFALVPRLNEKITALQYAIPRKVILISSFSQCLNLLAFYFSAFAYAWFYQASVVHAAESSLEQALDLLVAFILKKCFDVGRDSAVRNMKTKIISCAVITAGLFLIAYQDQLAEKIHEQSWYFEYNSNANESSTEIQGHSLLTVDASKSDYNFLNEIEDEPRILSSVDDTSNIRTGYVSFNGPRSIFMRDPERSIFAPKILNPVKQAKKRYGRSYSHEKTRLDV